MQGPSAQTNKVREQVITVEPAFGWFIITENLNTAIPPPYQAPTVGRTVGEKNNKNINYTSVIIIILNVTIRNYL